MQLLSVNQARQMLNIGKTKFYELLKSGAIPAKKLGRRTLVELDTVKQFKSELETYKPTGRQPASNKSKD